MIEVVGKPFTSLSFLLPTDTRALRGSFMTLNSLPLSYCTNVHPGLTVAEILQKLDEFTIPIQRQLGAPLAAGLWLAEPVIQEILSTPAGHLRFAEEIHKRDLTCYTLNAFPYGNFHSDRVKEKCVFTRLVRTGTAGIHERLCPGAFRIVTGRYGRQYFHGSLRIQTV